MRTPIPFAIALLIAAAPLTALPLEAIWKCCCDRSGSARMRSPCRT